MANPVSYYFYAPTWDCPPGGPIKLGNVLSSITKPHRPLYTAPLSDDADVFSTEKRDIKYSKEKQRAGRFSILTKFLSLLGLGVDVGAEINNRDEEIYSFDSLNTTEFIPNPEYIQKCIDSEAVRAFLHRARYRKPVYVITGVKTAIGARASSQSSRGAGGSLEVEIDATLWSGGAVPITSGPGASGHISNRSWTSWEGSSDFVFAFRVSKVLVKKTGTVASERDYTAGSMLGDEVGRLELPGLSAVWDQDLCADVDGLDQEELAEDEDTIVCVVLQPPDVEG